MTELRIKELKLTGKELVVQDNKLIDAPKILNLQEQKLFLFLVSKLDPNNPEDIVFRIAISEFAKAIGVESTTDVYRDVRKAIKNLMGKIVTVHAIEDGCKTTTDIPILGYAKYWHGKGYADIKISQEISPYLFSLNREFTQYKLSQITTLSSLYAIRIYEMLKKHEFFGKRTFFIDDLRKKLSIPDTKLKSFKDFRKYVLEISRREINAKTDIEIDLKFIKTGRKITSVQFDVISKDEKTEKNKTLYALDNTLGTYAENIIKQCNKKQKDKMKRVKTKQMSMLEELNNDKCVPEKNKTHTRFSFSKMFAGLFGR